MGATRQPGQSGEPVRKTPSRWFRGATLTVVIAVGLGGCSSLPDWANPVDWYDSAFNTDGAAPPESTRRVAKADGDKSFPSLKNTPSRAPATSSTADRAAATSGLIAARDKAKYTDEDLRSGGKSTVQAASQTAPQPQPMKKPAAKIASAAPQPVPVAPLNSRMSRLPKLASAAAPQPVPPIAPVPVAPTRTSAKPVAPAPLPPLVAPAAPAAPMPKPAMIATTPPPAPLPPLISGGAPTPVQQQGYGTQTAALSFPNAGQNALSAMFNAALAQSASTVTTAPASSTFNAPVAQPLNTNNSSLPGIVLAAYNDPLTGKSPASVTVNPGAALASGSSAMTQSRKMVVHFANGSAKLGRKAKKELRTAAQAYKQKRQGTIRVVGHASHFTKNMNLARHRMINFRVSLDRANEVARELMRHGVDASALRVEAVSDADPVYYEHMPEGQAHNRRAEIFLEF